jgi:PAS domain S-box-containing protein
LRPPDYEKENRALVALAGALAKPQSNILQMLAETILDVTQCDSSGLSLLTKDDGGKRFYWPAIAGTWGPHVGGGTPRDFGPCGDVLDQNRTLLFHRFERRYPYLLPVIPAAEECLLVPFYVGGQAVGTIWAIMHSDRRKFDAEDERLMSTLGQFASLAYQTVESIEELKLQIAAREKAEATARALASGLEAKVRRLIDANIIGIFIWNLDGKILEASEAFLRIVGYDRDDLISGRLRWRELTPAEWRDGDDRRVAELEATGTAQPYEKEYFRKNGSRVPVMVGSASFEGRSDEGVSFVLDMTDRKRAEEALRASEERWRAMFETAPVGITMLDFDHRRYLAANESFQRMTGYTEEELRQLTALDVTHEDDRAVAQKRIDDGVAGVLQKRYRRKDGGVIWADVSAFVVPATDSTPAFRGAVIVDITDRKRAEDALRRSEAYLNKVFETMPDGVAIIGRDYQYERVNPVYEDRTGLSCEQIVGMHIADINGVQAFNETIKPELDRCFAGEHVSYGRWSTRFAPGERYHAITYAPLFVNESRQPDAVLAITRDLTEFIRASEALQQAQADLARLNRVMLLEEMAASIAHEVNQPISAVITNANAGLRWLGARPPDLGEVRQALGRIVRDGARAGEVIDRIRALVKKVPPRRDLLDINHTIRDAIVLTRTEMQRNGVRWESRLAEELPLVSADGVQLQQVMINLIVNAVEAMASSGERPRELTIVSGTEDANDVFVEVRDTGPGLDPEELDRLFQSFYTTKPEGIGMGLAISRTIVEGHDGLLSAAQNQPRGAVFRFTLPTGDTPTRTEIAALPAGDGSSPLSKGAVN